MPRLLGIDIRPTVVRAALLRTSYRRVYLEGLNEVQRSHFATTEDAVRAAGEHLAAQHEAISVALEGHHAYVHRMTLPPAALKEVERVLPFELEAQIPIDFDELVYDARVLPREKGDVGVEVLAAAAPLAEVQQLIRSTELALGHEPERVSVGPVALGNLAQICGELGQRPTAIVDLGGETVEIVMLTAGATAFARTLSVGIAGLPGSAGEIVSGIKQSLAAFGTLSGHPVESIVLCGAGADLPGMEEYLRAYIGVEIRPLPPLELADLKDEHRPLLSRHAKAIAVALGLRAGSKDLDLRRGALAYQRGYGFIKEKIPTLVGLGTVTLVSFVFSAWAESRALAQEGEILSASLSKLAKEILDEETDDPERVQELLDKGTTAEKDPQPEKDAFDLAVALAERIPKEIEHDVDELELSKGRVKLTGVVPATEDAQLIAEEFKKAPCFANVTIIKIAQVIKSDRQKYTMEFDWRCEEEKPEAKKPKEGEATPEAEETE